MFCNCNKNKKETFDTINLDDFQYSIDHLYVLHDSQGLVKDLPFIMAKNVTNSIHASPMSFEQYFKIIIPYYTYYDQIQVFAKIIDDGNRVKLIQTVDNVSGIQANEGLINEKLCSFDKNVYSVKAISYHYERKLDPRNFKNFGVVEISTGTIEKSNNTQVDKNV